MLNTENKSCKAYSLVKSWKKVSKYPPFEKQNSIFCLCKHKQVKHANQLAQLGELPT